MGDASPFQAADQFFVFPENIEPQITSIQPPYSPFI
jgi:hypothetical protein